MPSRIHVMVCLVAIVASIPALATTYHVPDPYPTIQAGIDAASEGDTVLVACGTYYEGIVMKSGITLLSETGDADCVTNYGQIYCENTNENTCIEGFTLSNSHCAMRCLNSSPILTRIRFWASGCGLRCENSSSPHLTDCEFIGNISVLHGAGMTCVGGSPILERVVFDQNMVISLIGLGGGMFFVEGTPTLIDVLFSGNEAPWGGAGLYLSACKWASLTRVTFDRNIGNGADFLSCSPTLTSCTFYGNLVGMYVRGASPVLERTAIAFNAYGISCSAPDQPVLECCDIFGNQEGDWVGCIEDQYGINGNISEDPLFCDPENGDLTLQENSPCAPFSPPNEECDLIGAWPVGCDGPTSVESTTWGRIKATYR